MTGDYTLISGIDVNAILSKIDKKQLVQDVIDMVNITSPTGSEAAMGEYMANKYTDMGLQVIKQEVEPGRPNVFGILRGIGGGPMLQFDGHLDVSFTGKEPWMRGGQSTAFARIGEADGQEWVFGAGSYNMKAAHAAYMAAVNAIIKSGVKLKGDILLSATAGEIEATQVDDFVGPLYRGYGAGAAYAAAHGIVPDFAVLGEPTALKLMIGHFGSFWTKITATGGTVIHTAYTRDLPNKIEQMPKVIERFTRFKKEFEAKTEYKGYKGLVSMSSIQGGMAWKTSRSPATVSLYLDIRFPPGWTPLKVKAEVDKVLLELNQQDPKLKLEQQPYCTNPPTELSPDDYIVKSVQSAHKQVFNKDVEVIYELWYSNAPPLNSMGAKALNYGSAGSRKIKGLTLADKDREYIHIQDLYDCSKVYTLVALDVCSKTRAETRPDLA